ncbi:MAG: hypothetical protein IH626_20995 [Rhodospirillales bacterium]|nr:hypothetical protein [Rhodospirillales bacterium]
MTILANLKLTNSKRHATYDPVLGRREALANRLKEQRELAAAISSGQPFRFTRKIFETNAETGERMQVEKTKRVRPWFWTDKDGTCFFEVRYCNKALDLGKDKKAIEVEAPEKLPEIIDTVTQAVMAGELDKAIDAAIIRRKKS